MPIQWDLLNMIHKNMIIDDMITRKYGQASQENRKEKKTQETPTKYIES